MYTAVERVRSCELVYPTTILKGVGWRLGWAIADVPTCLASRQVGVGLAFLGQGGLVGHPIMYVAVQRDGSCE